MILMRAWMVLALIVYLVPPTRCTISLLLSYPTAAIAAIPTLAAFGVVHRLSKHEVKRGSKTGASSSGTVPIALVFGAVIAGTVNDLTSYLLC